MSLGSSLSSAQIYSAVWAQFHFSGPWLVQDSACGCPCAEWSDTPGDVAWARFECQECGEAGQGCRTQISEVARIFAALDVAEQMDEASPRLRLTEDFQRQSPKFCGDCRDHGLLALKRAAVQRARDRRAGWRGKEREQGDASSAAKQQKFSRGQTRKAE